VARKANVYDSASHGAWGAGAGWGQAIKKYTLKTAVSKRRPMQKRGQQPTVARKETVVGEAEFPAWGGMFERNFVVFLGAEGAVDERMRKGGGG